MGTPGAGAGPAPRPPAVLAAGTTRYCRPSVSYISGEPANWPPNRADHNWRPVSLSQARIWLSPPAPNTRPDSVTTSPLSSAGMPVAVMPRAASAGSSPKPMRHLMLGSFKSYFTIDVYGGLMRLPTVLYSLITGRSN